MHNNWNTKPLHKLSRIISDIFLNHFCELLIIKMKIKNENKSKPYIHNTQYFQTGQIYENRLIKINEHCMCR